MESFHRVIFRLKDDLYQKHIADGAAEDAEHGVSFPDM